MSFSSSAIILPDFELDDFSFEDNPYRRYFYDQLDEREKEMYGLLAGITIQDRSVSIPNTFTDYQDYFYHLVRAYYALENDKPEYAIVSGSLGNSTFTGNWAAVTEIVYTAQPLYAGMSEYGYQKAITRAKDIAAAIGKEKDSYSKISDLVLYADLTMRYNSFYQNFNGTRSVFYDSTPSGPLLYNTAVCSGFTL